MTEKSIYDLYPNGWGECPEGDVPISVGLDPNTDPNISEHVSGDFLNKLITLGIRTGHHSFYNEQLLVSRLTSYGKEVLVGHERLFRDVSIVVGLSLGVILAGYGIKKIRSKNSATNTTPPTS